MSPWPSRLSAPLWSRIVRESTLADTWNAMRVGMLALIRPVITSTDGRCVARIRWMPDGARLLREPRDQLLDLLADDHHHVGELVDDHDDVAAAARGIGTGGGSPPGGRRFNSSGSLHRLALVGGILDLAVEAGEVAHAQRRHQLVAPLHLGDAPAQRVGGLLHVGDDRREQVRDALVDRELQHLRVDHDQAHVLGAWPCRAATAPSR